MKQYGLNELRKMFLDFFESKGHLVMKSFSLVPHNDNSLLLINAGMAPLKPYFTGQEIPPRTRHFVKANILTEISPIIGSEEQARDLIGFINEKEQDSNVWDTNIFGKTIGEIVDEGIINKINNLTAETQSRMQGTIEKITNDQSRGVICIVL